VVIHSTWLIEAKKEFSIPDNLYEAIEAFSDAKSTIYYLKKIEMYNLV